MATEGDFIDALADALTATGAFAEVHRSGLPEDYGFAAGEATAAAIEPGSTRLATGWDEVPTGGLDFTCQLTVTVLARHPDPELCDRQARALVDTVRAAVAGRPLVPGRAVPQKTLATGWSWQRRVPPERRVAITVTYDYIEAGDADAADTTPP